MPAMVTRTLPSCSASQDAIGFLPSLRHRFLVIPHNPLHIRKNSLSMCSRSPESGRHSGRLSDSRAERYRRSTFLSTLQSVWLQRCPAVCRRPESKPMREDSIGDAQVVPLLPVQTRAGMLAQSPGRSGMKKPLTLPFVFRSHDCTAFRPARSRPRHSKWSSLITPQTFWCEHRNAHCVICVILPASRLTRIVPRHSRKVAFFFDKPAMKSPYCSCSGIGDGKWWGGAITHETPPFPRSPG